MVTQIQRVSQIVEILGKYGFGLATAKVFPGQSRIRFPEQTEIDQRSSRYERMRLVLEELGPTFVKFGQIMATRTDLFPAEMIAELKKLQDHVKPVPFDEILPLIEQACPQSCTWMQKIDEIPVASASIAQVHRAVLADGTVVALKIQRPGIQEIIETDLKVLASMAERIERVFPDSRVYNPTGMVKDFAVQIRKELDFLQEARTALRMQQNFSEVEGIRFPKIFPEHSSSRILVMEFVEGIRIDNKDELARRGFDVQAIGARGFHAYCKMVFEDGYFHGDPHPGNLLVTRDGEIVVLDFGIAGVLRPEKRQSFIEFLIALTNQDTGLLLRSLAGLGVIIPDGNREHLEDELFVLMQDLDLRSSISRFNFAAFVTELAEVMRRYQIQVPSDLMLLLKVLVMILDIGVRLDPDFNIEEELSPYLRGVAVRNVISGRTGKKIVTTLSDAVDAVLDMPRYLNLMLRRLSTGAFRLELVDKDLRQLIMALDSSSDKIMIGFVVASLVIGSSLMLKALKFPLPAAVSWIALLGYGAAALTAFYVIYHILLLKFRSKQ